MEDLKDDGIFLSQIIKENELHVNLKASKIELKKRKNKHLSGMLKEKGNTCLPLPMTSVPGEDLISL